MISEETLLQELTRNAILLGKMEATLAALLGVMARPMTEPDRWFATSLINERLAECKTVHPVQHWKAKPAETKPVETKPNGVDTSQPALPLKAPEKHQSAAERRRAAMERHPITRPRLPG